MGAIEAVVDSDRGFGTNDVGWNVMVWENGFFFFFCLVNETAENQNQRN